MYVHYTCVSTGLFFDKENFETAIHNIAYFLYLCKFSILYKAFHELNITSIIPHLTTKGFRSPGNMIANFRYDLPVTRQFEA